MTTTNIRSATRTEKAKVRAVGFSAFLVVLMLTLAITFTAVSLNANPKDSKNPGQDDTKPVNAPVVFAMPVSGTWTLLKDCLMDELQYNATNNRWEAHLAVALGGAENTPVVATYAGVVKSVTSNTLYGTTVTIEHSDGLETVYSSLAKNVMVSSGDRVEKGQQIGVVGDTASYEMFETPFVRVEVKKDGKKVNPADYIELYK